MLKFDNWEDLIVCDFEKKGNVIRLYLTTPEDYDDVYIDDSDDRPYEHNAGTVSDYYPYTEIAFPLKIWVTEPADDWHYNGNSPYSKDDFKAHKAPCLLIGDLGNDWNDSYSVQLGNKNLLRIYYGDNIRDILLQRLKYNGIVITIPLYIPIKGEINEQG